MTKFVFVVGGVYSGTGKGIATASLGLLLKLRNLKVQITKFDPYLNTDAGVLAPREHGETFVLEDGKEVDLDFDTTERDGMFDYDRKFAIYSQKDIQDMINKLQSILTK